MDPATAAALIGGGAALVGGMMNNQSNAAMSREAAVYNQATAREQMEFQRYMSNTSHQREVADLRAAGLNPILSAGGSGSSTPGGAAGQMQAAKFEDPISKSLSTAMEVKRLKKEIDAVDSQAQLNAAAEETQKSQRLLNLTNARATAVQSAINEAQLPAIKAKSEYEQKKTDIDNKMLKYDSLMNRVKQATGTISDAASIIKPKININRGQTKEIYIDKNTGEILK